MESSSPTARSRPSPSPAPSPSPSARPLTILQLFNRYLKPGGEEKSIARMAEDLESGGHRVVRFWRETAEWQRPDAPSKFRQALLLWNNPEVLDELRRRQEETRADLWL